MAREFLVRLTNGDETAMDRISAELNERHKGLVGPALHRDFSPADVLIALLRSRAAEDAKNGAAGQ